MLEFNSYFNELTPISRLPPEILTKIFLMHVSRYTEFPPTRRWMPRRWISFSHVCQYWRSVAIACPMLWRSIYFPSTSPGLISEFLARTQKVPLIIAATSERALRAADPLHKPRWQSILQTLIAEEMPRIEGLHTLLDPDLKVVGSAISLRQLTIGRCFLEERSDVPDLSEILGSFSNIVHGNDAPVLENLKICFMNFEFCSPFHYPNLKSLCLRTVSTDIASLVAALAEMPVLEDLILHNCWMDNYVDPMNCLVTLSRVRTISLRGWLNCINFLIYLNCPSVKTIKVSCQSDARNQFIARIRQLSGLRFIKFSEDQRQLSQWIVLTLTAQSFSGSPTLIFRIRKTAQERRPYKLIGDALSLSDLETIKLHDLCTVSKMDIEDILSQIPSVRVLQIHGSSDLMSIFAALFERDVNPSRNADGDGHTSFLPHLTAVTFDEIYFSSQRDRRELEGLRDTLRKMDLENKPRFKFREIRWINCHVCSQVVDLLIEIIGVEHAPCNLPGTHSHDDEFPYDIMQDIIEDDDNEDDDDITDEGASDDDSDLDIMGEMDW